MTLPCRGGSVFIVPVVVSLVRNERHRQADAQELRLVRCHLPATTEGKVVVVDDEQGACIEHQYVLDRDVGEGEDLAAVAIEIVRVGEIASARPATTSLFSGANTPGIEISLRRTVP